MAEILNLEELDILDKQLDDIEDLAGFAVPPNGRYLLNLKMDVKTVNDKPAVEVSLSVAETRQLEKETEVAPIVGTAFSLLFFLAGEEKAIKMSLGRLKELCAPLGEHFGTANLKEIIGRCKDETLIEATVKRRADKEDPEKFYASLKNVAVV